MTFFSGSLRRSFVISGAATTLFLAIVACIGLWATMSLGTALKTANVASQALRNSMTADMMHDALRADAFAAIVAEGGGSDADKAKTRADLEEHAATLKNSVAENRALPLSAPLKTALEAVDGPLASYLAAAQQIVRLGLEDPAAARRELPPFLSAFRELETAMGRAGDLIEAEVSNVAHENEALARTATLTMIGAFVLGSLAVLAANLLLGRAVAPPIAAMTTVMGRLAAGDISVDVPSTERRNEIGAMARAVDAFKRNAIAIKQLEADRARQKALVEEERRAEMTRLADRFEAEVLGIVASVSASAEQLRQNAETMRSTATDTSGRSTVVAAAAEEATANVQAVADAASQLSEAIHEIARQVHSASNSTAAANLETSGAVDLVNRLAATVARIGEAVTLISDVSSQTNLLALNATIEAARAGDAGRGFAIVAQEVKLLAEQSAKATEEIGGHIDEVRGATSRMVQAIGAIRSSISDVDGISSAIAAAVEEQGAATSDIARSVGEASVGTREVSSNILGVNAAAERTGKASDEIVDAASNLARQAESLRAQVSGFISQVRAA